MIHRRARYGLWGANEVNDEVVVFEPETSPKKKQVLEGHPHHQQTRSRKKHRRFMDVMRLTRFYVLDHRRSVRLVRLGASDGPRRLVVKAHQD